MSRICIICEGQTEKVFIDDCVKPLLARSGIYLHTELLGGNVSTQRIARFVRASFNYFEYITTFVDFYGYKNNNASNRPELETEIMVAAQALFKREPLKTPCSFL